MAGQIALQHLLARNPRDVREFALAAKVAAELFPEATPEMHRKARAMAEIARPHIQSRWGRPAHERQAMAQKIAEISRRNAQQAI